MERVKGWHCGGHGVVTVEEYISCLELLSFLTIDLVDMIDMT